MRFNYEEIREIDYDGETGSIMGFLVEGHIDDFDVQVFIGNELEEHYYDGGPARGFDVMRLWWSTAPYYDDEGLAVEGSYIYVYSPVPLEGYKAATRIEENHEWERWCTKHPEETAVAGIPLEQFVAGSEKHSPDGKHIYYCSPCLRLHDERRRARIAEEMAKPENRSERCPDCNMLTVLRLHECDGVRRG